MLDSEAGLRRGLHVLRERWRRHQFELFLKLDRHEAREIAAADHVGYDADRVKRAALLYKDVTTEARGVMLSGGKSEEYYSCMRWGKPPVGSHWCTTCSLCSASVLPSWHHAAWHCSAFAASRPTVAGDAWSSRLGWPMPHERKDLSQARVLHLAAVRKRLRELFGFRRGRKRRLDANAQEDSDA